MTIKVIIKTEDEDETILRKHLTTSYKTYHLNDVKGLRSVFNGEQFIVEFLPEGERSETLVEYLEEGVVKMLLTPESSEVQSFGDYTTFVDPYLTIHRSKIYDWETIEEEE